MKKRDYWIVTLALLLIALAHFQPARAQDFNGSVQQIIDDVSLDSLINYVRELSGEDPVTIGDSTFFVHRGTGSGFPGAFYLQEKLRGWGVESEITINSDSLWGGGVQGVIVTQPGTGGTGESLIICAHYDYGIPPGADDNASGVAVVLEAIRLLSHYDTYYTVIYALWNAEEFFMLGSWNYSNQARAGNVPIKGVLNLEMLGFDGNDDGRFEIHTRDIANSVALAQSIQLANDRYSTGLIPEIINPGTGASDHASFWFNDYSAVVMSQQYWGGDFNPTYHTNRDRIELFNLGYYHNMAKLAIASIAHLAVVDETSIANENPASLPYNFSLSQNYPNPFNPSTSIRFDVPEASKVSLKVYDMLGRQVVKLVDGIVSAGEHTATFDARTLPSGAYIYRLETPEGTFTKTMLLLK